MRPARDPRRRRETGPPDRGGGRPAHRQGPSDPETLVLDGRNANVWLGGRGRDGDVVVFPSAAKLRDPKRSSVHLDGDGAAVRVGREEGGTKPGVVAVRDNVGHDGVVLHGAAGQDRRRDRAGPETERLRRAAR